MVVGFSMRQGLREENWSKGQTTQYNAMAHMATAEAPSKVASAAVLEVAVVTLTMALVRAHGDQSKAEIKGGSSARSESGDSDVGGGDQNKTEIKQRL